MTIDQEPVKLSVEDDHVLALHSELLSDRKARMFFGSILRAEPTVNGWRCARRRSSIQNLVVRVNTFLESKGWTVSRSGVADESVTREIERKRSFQRTKERATALRDGEVTTQFSAINETLKAFGWSEEGRALFEHQQQGAVHGLTAVNAASFSVPGSGKTALFAPAKGFERFVDRRTNCEWVEMCSPEILHSKPSSSRQHLSGKQGLDGESKRGCRRVRHAGN